MEISYWENMAMAQCSQDCLTLLVDNGQKMNTILKNTIPLFIKYSNKTSFLLQNRSFKVPHYQLNLDVGRLLPVTRGY